MLKIFAKKTFLELLSVFILEVILGKRLQLREVRMWTCSTRRPMGTLVSIPQTKYLHLMLSFYEVTYNITSPVFNPNYSSLFYNEKFNLTNMARKYVDEMRSDRIDVFSFVLYDIYNLYIYYFSIGVFPINDALAEILLSMDIHDIELPSTEDHKTYFDV
jgi:hypothetical protein